MLHDWDMENWLPIIGYEDLYEVSDLGRIRSLRQRGGQYKMILATPSYAKDLRPIKVLWRGRESKTFKVCTLVMTTFVGQRPEGLECCHNDGDCANNVLTNLRWDTHASNMADKKRHGTRLIGTKNPLAKLSEKDIRKIRADMRVQHITAKEYKINQATVSSIKLRKTWGHVL